MDEKVYQCVSRIPSGWVMSYASVAEVCGFPGRAQMVGWSLKRLKRDTSVPWHRVIASSGRISIVNPDHHPIEQVERLQQEGIIVDVRPDGWYVISPRWYKG